MTPEGIRTLAKALSIVAVACGAFGMALCLPFALSRYLHVIAAAGIYFVTGAVMIVGGLISYAILLKLDYQVSVTQKPTA